MESITITQMDMHSNANHDSYSHDFARLVCTWWAGQVWRWIDQKVSSCCWHLTFVLSSEGCCIGKGGEVSFLLGLQFPKDDPKGSSWGTRLMVWKSLLHWLDGIMPPFPQRQAQLARTWLHNIHVVDDGVWSIPHREYQAVRRSGCSQSFHSQIKNAKLCPPLQLCVVLKIAP